MVQQGRGKFPVKEVSYPPHHKNIGSIGSLKRYPDAEYAKSLLYDAARLVASIISEHKFKIGQLREMFPKQANLLGLNVNYGSKILLRLRHHHNDRSFLSIEEIVETFLHELTHNLYGPHDKKFYDFLDKLKTRYDDIKYRRVATNYFTEENVLGRSRLPGSTNLISVREKRLQVFDKPRYMGGSKVLGTSSDSKITKTPKPRPKDMKQAILEAAERRLRDSKWCHSENPQNEEVPDDSEFDIVEVDKGEFESVVNKPDTKPQSNIEIIDLTSDVE
ncbi:WSS1 DNA-dependent metalloprotease WSS1 [Candida maltosa Xu316]|uniref:WLM domain-containing protein n=1 Tax=Candida maltosa (strain Xu316) TaxID=1245528 RepID=M3JXU2_CANMX|nr:hypothetical protein G210_2451 [Candida maltosa Xu316]